MLKSKFKKYKVTCPHDCPDTCSLEVTVDTKIKKAIKLIGDKTHPITKGFLCNKVNHYLDLVYNKNRVLYPYVRVGSKGKKGKLKKVSWDFALKTIAKKLKAIEKEHGAEAIQPYSYSGTLGMLGYWGMSERFWNKMGAARLGRTICIAAASTAGIYTYGAACGPAIDEVPNNDLIILWGTNIVSTHVHMVPFVEEAKKRGAKIICIDPRETRTAAISDWHIQPKPGTDAALALGMMNEIVKNKKHDLAFLKTHTTGYKEFIEKILPKYSLDKVSRITGIKKADIQQLALEYGSSKKTYIRPNYGLNRHRNGGMMVRSIMLLPAITGAWENKSSGCFVGSIEEMWNVDLGKLQRPDLLKDKKPRSINMIQIGNALNDKKLDPPIKSLFIWNSDIANCAPDSNSVRKGLKRKDLFTVVHETFWTDSCDYADIVLPADTQLEHMDLHAPYGHYYFSLTQPAIKPLGESKSNQDLFRELAKYMGYKDKCFKETDESMIKNMIDPKHNPLFKGVTFEKLKKNGWVKGDVENKKRDYLKNGWPTKDGKIQICSKDTEKIGLGGYPEHIEEFTDKTLRKKYPIQILSPATHQFIGNSFVPVERLRDMASRPTIEMSSKDARKRKIKDGDLCKIYNDVGETYAHAVIIDSMLEGVASTQKQYKGSLVKNGVNANALNTQDVTDMGDGPIFYTVLAQIKKA